MHFLEYDLQKASRDYVDNQPSPKNRDVAEGGLTVDRGGNFYLGEGRTGGAIGATPNTFPQFHGPSSVSCTCLGTLQREYDS